MLLSFGREWTSISRCVMSNRSGTPNMSASQERNGIGQSWNAGSEIINIVGVNKVLLI